MKVYQLITLLMQCPAGCDVEIGSTSIVAEEIIDIEIPKSSEETCFLFICEDPEIMNDESEILGNLSSFIPKKS